MLNLRAVIDEFNVENPLDSKSDLKKETESSINETSMDNSSMVQSYKKLVEPFEVYDLIHFVD